jgi:hypothetical protein
MMNLCVGTLFVGNQAYKFRILEGVKAIMHEYWVENSFVSLNKKEVVRRRISRGEYEEHAKYSLEIT